MLAALAPNGGPTDTHALVPPSPAIDAGNPAVPGSGGTACLATDQRGETRPGGLGCDMGAFELKLCGNNVLDPGEVCDDGNQTSGDGCDANCTITACGNGVVTAGEQCDDGNLVDDCCGSTCQLATPGAPCSDGNACTIGDGCAAGACIAGSPCEPCQDCIPGVGCEAPDQCELPEPGGSSAGIKDASVDAKDMVTWKWKSTDPANFADPITQEADYILCVYDGNGASTPVLVAPHRLHVRHMLDRKGRVA